jgi:hypothetical protein
MTNLSTLIDQYAALKSAMGKLEAEKKALEAALAEVPAGAYESARRRGEGGPQGRRGRLPGHPLPPVRHRPH